MTENQIARVVVDVAYRVHVSLGPGLLESVDEAIMAHELRKRGLAVQRQVPLPVVWDGVRIEEGFRLVLLVEGKVVVELKSVEAVAAVRKEQLLTHLRLADRRLGLLINFGAPYMKGGITRIANGMPPLSSSLAVFCGIVSLRLCGLA